MRLVAILGAVAVSALVWVGAAVAQSSSESGYAGQGGAVQSGVEGGGSLPFTGLDLGLLIGGGALLLAVGFGLRRASRARA